MRFKKEYYAKIFIALIVRKIIEEYKHGGDSTKKKVFVYFHFNKINILE
jgi:hypothetical protein